MRKITITLLAALMLLIDVSASLAQMTTVLPGGTGTSGNGRAPSPAFRRIRTQYLITAAELSTAGYLSGSVPGRIGFTYTVAPVATGTSPLTIYMQNTADVTNTKSTTWATAIAPMTVVHNASTTITAGVTTPNITLTGGSPFTYTGGGIYIAFDWGCYSGTTAATTTSCNTLLVGGLSGTQNATVCPGTAPLTTVGSNFRPETRLGPPQPANDLGISHIYTQGNLAVGYCTNNIIRARITNEGSNAMPATTADMNITGANSFSSLGVVVPALAPGAATVISFGAYTPTALGANNIAVTLPADDIAGNNLLNQAQTTSKDINSYRYTAPIIGGVGFNGGTGDFLGKFTAANNFGNSDTINGFEVIFFTGGQPYNVGVWTDVAGSPGVNIYTSPSNTSVADTIFIPLPDIEVSGSYWVGIRQTGLVNVSFGYQAENPVRDQQFKYTAPTGGVVWTDFAPGAPFRISATVQYKTPVPPNCAVYLAPANAGVACKNGTTLTYGSGGAGPTGYRVYFGTNQALVQAEDPGTLVQNNASTSYATGTLLNATTYYWRVTAYNLNGDASGCATLSRSFTTNLASCYCASTATNGTFEYVTGVASGVFNSGVTGSNLYSNNTGMGVINNVNIGSVFNVTVDINPLQVYDEDRIYIFADWNQDGDWSDLGELCGNGDVTIAGGATYIVPCTVPASALPGNTLLRIKFGDEVSTTAMNNDPCQAAYTFGEVEDYLLNVTCGSSASSNNPVCELAALNLSSTYIGLGTPTLYSWTTTAANGFTSAAPNPSVTASATSANDNGTYTVVITDNNACTSSSSVIVTVLPAPQAQANGTDVCAGLPLGVSSSNLLEGMGQTSIGYSWTTTAANLFTSGSQSPSVTGSASANDAGIYTVVITNNFLCTASANVTIAVNANPSLAFVSSVGISCYLGACDGNVTVSASGGTPGYLYADPNANFSANGIFTGNQCEGNNQLMTVTDALGCEATLLYNVGHISAAPPAGSVAVPSIAGLPVSACNGTGPLAISVPAVVGATYYTWDGPAGTTINGSNPVNSPTPTGNITFGSPNGSGYYIGVQAANGCGTSTRKVQWVRGITSVPASVIGNAFACANTNGVPYNTGITTGATGYLWSSTGDITIMSGQGTQNITVDFGPAFTSGTLCVASQTSCYTSANKCITILNSVPTLPVISGSASVCPGPYVYSVPFNANIASYAWTLPAGITGSSTSNSISVTVAPGFSAADICVTGTSTCGINTTTRCKSLSTGAPATPASITGITNGLCGQTVIYQCPSVGPVTYTWSGPPGTVFNSAQGNNAMSMTLGTFVTGQVCVTTSNGCGTGVPRCVSINGKPNTPGAITSIPASWCANTTGVEFNVDVTPVSGSYTLSWLYPGPTVATYSLGGGNSTQLILDWITGPGPVNVTASNACGNSTRTSTQQSTCREGEQAVASAEQTLLVYPNPTSGMLHVDFNAAIAGVYNVNVTDLAGRSVMMQQGKSVVGSNGTSVDLTNVAKGMYVIEVKQNNETRLVKVSVE